MVYHENTFFILQGDESIFMFVSLSDKVYAMATLQAAWQQVQKNKGNYGVDGMSIERFAAKQEQYLLKLQEALKEGSHQPLPVKRVFIPKAGGGERP